MLATGPYAFVAPHLFLPVFPCVNIVVTHSGKKGTTKSPYNFILGGVSLWSAGGGVIEEIKETGKNIFPSMFSRAAGRVVRLSSGVAVLQGTCHPPLAAHTRLTPRHWKEADDQVDSTCLGFRFRV